LKDLDAIEKVIKEPLAREAAAVKARKEGAAGGFGFGGPPGGAFGGALPPRKVIEKRVESVAAQLAGQSKGYGPPAGVRLGAPGGGFGGPPGGGFGGPAWPQPGEIMPRALQEQLKLTPAQRKRLEELQKEVDRKVEAILTDEQKALLKKLRSRPGGPGGGPPRP